MKKRVKIIALAVVVVLVVINVVYIVISPLNHKGGYYDYGGGWPLAREYYSTDNEESGNTLVEHPEVFNALFAFAVIFASTMTYYLVEKTIWFWRGWKNNRANQTLDASGEPSQTVKITSGTGPDASRYVK